MSVQELLILIAVIAILSFTGLWPEILRALRELRGETPQYSPPPTQRDNDVEIACRLLGVSSSSSWEQIEKAYRAKAKVHHPDLGGDADAMRALNEAYKLLKERRRKP